MMKKIVSVIWMMVLLTACGNKEKTEDKQAANTAADNNSVLLTEAQVKNAGIETGKPETRNISSLLKVNGRIDVPPQNIVSISVPLGGYLQSSKLLAGMHVSKGETLALMQDPQYIQLQQDYLTAKTKLAYAEQEYNRQKELNESKASSDKVYQQAQAEFNSQKILLKALGEKLRLININPDKLTAETITRYVSVPSPIDGFVSKVNVNIGKYVNPSDALFEIVNPEDIHLGLDIFEKDISKLSIGQTVFAYTNTNPEKRYPCKIILISKNISGDKSFEVHCHFEKYDKELLPGMFMNAEIQVQSKDSYVLPSDAIVSFEKKQYVFIDKGNNQFEIAEVTSGNSEDGFTEIDNDSANKLKSQAIVVKGAYNLLMKMKNTAGEE
ncbi:MAG: efflux RND transporter periplasmic adaptor subunit [Bacteroidetes bacterium]|nr:efflux RND transporter periplasmic adaptor subunit [Bacteroidota bacterium]